MPNPVTAIGNRLPRGWGDLARQILIILLVDLVYETARGLADGKKSVAFAHGQQIIDLEKATGTFFEPAWQEAVIGIDWLMTIANQVYMNSQFAVVLGFFVWIYFFRNDSYYFIRNMFAAAMVLGVIGYTLYPTAPPRMFPEYGFIDTINDYSSVNHDSALVKLFINPYAAVPSLHCAFSLMLGASGFMLVRRVWLKALFAGWPLLVAWVTVVTANHYWIDIALGWAVAISAALIAAQVLARLRPRDWSFRGAPAPEPVTATAARAES